LTPTLSFSKAKEHGNFLDLYVNQNSDYELLKLQKKIIFFHLETIVPIVKSLISQCTSWSFQILPTGFKSMEWISYYTSWYHWYLSFQWLDQYRITIISYRFKYQPYRDPFNRTEIKPKSSRLIYTGPIPKLQTKNILSTSHWYCDINWWCATLVLRY